MSSVVALLPHRYFLTASTQSQHGHVFAMNNVTGELYVVGVVDREATASYQLMIGAHDLGQAPLSSEAMVVISVEDVNDNAPVMALTR